MSASAHIRGNDAFYRVAEKNLALVNVHSSITDTSGAAGLYLPIKSQMTTPAYGLDIWRH